MAVLGPHMERHAEKAFRWLRRHKPVVGGKRFALVVRDADVRRVLASKEEFSVHRYTGKMLEVTGDFALAFDERGRHEAAQNLIAPAFVHEHSGRLAERARDLAERRMDDAKGRGTIDVLGGYLDPVLAGLVGEYLGITGLSTRNLLSWCHTVFTEIFICPKDFIRPHAMGVVQEFRAHIDDLIAARRAKPGAKRDDLLGRMLASQAVDSERMSDAEIRGTLLGLAVAWIPNTAKTLALVVDELLDRPPELAVAQAVARRGSNDELMAIIREAARFRPQGPGIFRTTIKECRVGVDGNAASTLRARIPVLACTASAMMDEEAVDQPRQFRAGRPAATYLHFGYGMHTCAGRSITESTTPELLRALLKEGPLHRVDGRAGRLQWRYPYPSHLVVRFR